MTNPHRRTVASAALAMTGCLLLAACGSSTPAAHTAPAVQTTTASTDAASVATTDAASTAATTAAAPTAGGTACEVVTEQDATTALGADPGPGIADSQGIATSCTFGTPPSVLTVNLVPTGGKAAYEHALGVVEADHPAVTIAGVGDGAFGDFKGSFATIEFYKGDVLVNVVLGVTGASSPPKAQALALAKTAAGRV